MKDINNIEDWYRDELNNYNVEPDKNGWNSLAGDLDNSTPLTDETVSDWYKKEVSKLEERPDYTVWEKLATQLDTASVWDKLAVSLTKYDQLIWLRNIAIRGSAVLLLLFVSYLTFDNFVNTDEKLANNNTSFSEGNKSYSHIHKINVNSSNLESESAIDNNSQKIIGTSTKTLAANRSKNQATSESTIRQTVKNAKTELLAKATPSEKEKNRADSKLYASKNKIVLAQSISIKNLEALKTKNERTIITEIKAPQLNGQNISHHLKKGEYLVKKDNNKIVFNSKRFSSYSMFGVYTRRIYAGFNIGLKKQGMMTSLQEDSQLANYSQNILLDFGNSFGGTVGFILSDNINIEANINLNSTSGYKRAFNAEGISYQENLNLNYTTINLLAKKMNTKSTFDNKVYSTNFIVGVYASYLRSSVSEIDGATQKLDNFNTTDYGIVLGIEQDRYITKTLVITPGIRYNQGITNIANSDNNFKAARNFSLEFNLGVKYIFLKKGK